MGGVFEQKFSVRGPKDSLVTYLFIMTVNLNFMVSAGFKFYLARDEEGSLSFGLPSDSDSSSQT